MYFYFPVTFFQIWLPTADIDECRLEPKPCAYRCLNTKGDYECLCPPGSKRLPDKKSCEGVGGQKCRPGYQFIHGRGCIDIDECRINTTCQHRCVNEVGGYRCYCPTGYRVDRKGRCIGKCSTFFWVFCGEFKRVFWSSWILGPMFKQDI